MHALYIKIRMERTEYMKIDLFIALLRSELTKTEPDAAVKEQLTPDMLSELYTMSKRQDLAHIVSAALYKNGLLTDEKLQDSFRREEAAALLRTQRMKTAFQIISNTLAAADIAYIPLKGLAIRPYYPEESMRTSCDMDILVKREDLDGAISALTAKGFRLGEPNYHDVSLYSPSNIHVELHFSVQEKMDSLDAVLKDVWQYALPEQGARHRLTDEFFVFYLYAHMNYHFLRGGCGVRCLMDIWVMEQKMGLSCEQAKELLEKGGIWQFAAELSKLSRVCFAGEPGDAFSETLLQYMVESSLYGSAQNRMVISKAEANHTLGYALKRLFLPYQLMTEQYPVLEKAPILLPACWAARFFKMLFGGKTGRIMNELKTVHSIPGQDMEAMQQIRRRLGL